MAEQIIWRLRIGARQTGFTVEPDGEWPGMWRIHAPNGKVSDMVNLSRAKDACIAWARPRGLGGGEKAFWDRRETVSGAGLAGDQSREAPG